jgi:adenine-specific DNA-methyltransferase
MKKKQHDKFVGLVTQMLAAQKQFHSAKSESDKKHYQQKIDLLDKQIDALVYELYGLTEEEIKVVEGSLK